MYFPLNDRIRHLYKIILKVYVIITILYQKAVNNRSTLTSVSIKSSPFFLYVINESEVITQLHSISVVTFFSFFVSF